MRRRGTLRVRRSCGFGIPCVSFRIASSCVESIRVVLRCFALICFARSSMESTWAQRSYHPEAQGTHSLGHRIPKRARGVCRVCVEFTVNSTSYCRVCVEFDVGTANLVEFHVKLDTISGTHVKLDTNSTIRCRVYGKLDTNSTCPPDSFDLVGSNVWVPWPSWAPIDKCWCPKFFRPKCSCTCFG